MFQHRGMPWRILHPVKKFDLILVWIFNIKYLSNIDARHIKYIFLTRKKIYSIKNKEIDRAIFLPLGHSVR